MKNKILDERSFNYFRIDNEFIDQQVKMCGWQGLSVYTSLCRHANKEGSCFPSINTISKELGIDRKTVMKGLNSLVERNIITIKNTFRKDGGYSNNFYILIDKKHWKIDDIKETPKSTTRTTPSGREGLPLVDEKDSKNTNNNNTNNKYIIADKSAKDNLDDNLSEDKQKTTLKDLYSKFGLPEKVKTVTKWQDEAANAIKYFSDIKGKESSVFKCFKDNNQKARIALSDCKELNQRSVYYFLKVYNELKKK